LDDVLPVLHFLSERLSSPTGAGSASRPTSMML
jgi:hypothetical protein